MTSSLLFRSLLLTTSDDFNINFLILSITLSSYSSGCIFLSNPLCYTSSSLSMGISTRPPMLNLLPLVALIFHSTADFSYAVPSSFDNFASTISPTGYVSSFLQQFLGLVYFFIFFQLDFSDVQYLHHSPSLEGF
jgi:hypothetical protein